MCVALATTFTANTTFANVKLNPTVEYRSELTDNSESIQEVFDLLEYDVEDADGDQRAIQDAQKNAVQNLQDLKSAGVTSVEIQRYMENTLISDKNAKKEYRATLAALTVQNASDAEVLAVTMDFAANNTQTGAAFSGGAGADYTRIALIAGIVIMAAVTIYMMIEIKKLKEDGVDGKDGKDGKDGEDGEDGTNGTDGEDGTNGTDGVDGTNGTDGVDGTNGTNGTDGVDGTNGTDGEDGVDGNDGKDGIDGVCNCEPGKKNHKKNCGGSKKHHSRNNKNRVSNWWD